MDTAGAILHEFQIRGYDFAIGMDAVNYLIGNDLECAELVIGAFDQSGTKVYVGLLVGVEYVVFA